MSYKETTMIEYTVRVCDYKTDWRNKLGQLHREDGPAREYAQGSKAWYKNGELHREDGPACEFDDGSKAWWIHDELLTEDQFNNRNKIEMTVADIEAQLGYQIKIVK